jgi:hypothetical protein
MTGPVIVQSPPSRSSSTGFFVLVVVVIIVVIYFIPGILGFIWSEAKVVGIWEGEDLTAGVGVTYTFGWLGKLYITYHLPEGDIIVGRDYMMLDETTMRFYIDEYDYDEFEYISTLTTLELTYIDPDTGEPSTDPNDTTSLFRSYGLYL